jgi:hypothetical protein
MLDVGRCGWNILSLTHRPLKTDNWIQVDLLTFNRLVAGFCKAAEPNTGLEGDMVAVQGVANYTKSNYNHHSVNMVK